MQHFSLLAKLVVTQAVSQDSRCVTGRDAGLAACVATFALRDRSQWTKAGL